MTDDLNYFVMKDKSGNIQGLILTSGTDSEHEIQKIIDFAERLYEKNKEDLKEYYDTASQFALSILMTHYAFQLKYVEGEITI